MVVAAAVVAAVVEAAPQLPPPPLALSERSSTRFSRAVPRRWSRRVGARSICAPRAIKSSRPASVTSVGEVVVSEVVEEDEEAVTEVTEAVKAEVVEAAGVAALAYFPWTRRMRWRRRCVCRMCSVHG